jgi:hypothetical protein
VIAVRLRAGHVITQEVGTGRDTRQVSRLVLDAWRATIGGVEWVLVDAVEDGRHPLRLHYPPGWQVAVGGDDGY